MNKVIENLQKNIENINNNNIKNEINNNNYKNNFSNNSNKNNIQYSIEKSLNKLKSDFNTTYKNVINNNNNNEYTSDLIPEELLKEVLINNNNSNINNINNNLKAQIPIKNNIKRLGIIFSPSIQNNQINLNINKKKKINFSIIIHS